MNRVCYAIRNIQKSCRRTEDKVCSSFNIAVGKQQAATLRTCINSILISPENDSRQTSACLLRYGAQLPGPKGAALFSMVRFLKVMSLPSTLRYKLECAHFIDIGMIIIRDDRLFGIFTYQLHVLHPTKESPVFSLYIPFFIKIVTV